MSYSSVWCLFQIVSYCNFSGAERGKKARQESSGKKKQCIFLGSYIPALESKCKYRLIMLIMQILDLVG
jgi:hypothetical protein